MSANMTAEHEIMSENIFDKTIKFLTKFQKC